MARTVVAMFDSLSEAQDAVQDLVDNGVPRDHISVVGNDARGEYTTEHDHDHESAAAEGAGAGAVGGGVVGGVLGLLVGIGALAIPGIGPVIAAGPLVAALGTAAAGAGIGAAAGGLLGALVGAGIPEEDAHLYAEGVRRGGTLVTVTTEQGMADTAYRVLHRHNAVDVDERGRMYRDEGWERFDPDATPYTESGSYDAYAGAGSYPRDSAKSDWEESSKVGTAGGTVAGAATGAAMGSVGGPVGTVVGGAAGAVVGAGVGAAGDAAGEAAEDAARGEDDPTRVRSDAVDTQRPDYAERSRPLSPADAETTYDETRNTTHSGDYHAGTTSSATLEGAAATPRSRPRVYDTDSQSQVYTDADRRTDDSGMSEWEESSKVGTAGGAVAGAATGAAMGAAGGPVGAVVGGVAGATVGGGVGAAGDAAGEAAEDEARGEDDLPPAGDVDDDAAAGRRGQVDPGV